MATKNIWLLQIYHQNISDSINETIEFDYFSFINFVQSFFQLKKLSHGFSGRNFYQCWTPYFLSSDFVICKITKKTD